MSCLNAVLLNCTPKDDSHSKLYIMHVLHFFYYVHHFPLWCIMRGSKTWFWKFQERQSWPQFQEWLWGDRVVPSCVWSSMGGGAALALRRAGRQGPEKPAVIGWRAGTLNGTFGFVQMSQHDNWIPIE